MPDGGADFAQYELASAATLAEQPPIMDDDTVDYLDRDWDIIYAHLESRRSMLSNVRYSWWSHWSQLAQFILPERYRWIPTPNITQRGNQLNQSILNSSGTIDMKICAAGMVEGLMPTTRPWVKVGIGIPNYQAPAPVKIWLSRVEQILYTVLSQSNFYTEMAQFFRDMVTFGTGVAIMYEDAAKVLRLYVPCAGEYFCAVGSTQEVDVLYREFTMTISAIVEMFGIENCGREIQGLYKQGGGSLENEYVVCHAIEPNFDLDSTRSEGARKVTVVKGGFTYREFYWLRGIKTERPLSKRGFWERPFAVGRWSKTSNDAYGRGPGMDALPDIRQLQLETMRKAEFIDKGVRPPMTGPPELKNEPSSIRPGDITYVLANGAKFEPAYQVNPQMLQPMVEDLEKIEARIGRAFYVDAFQAISKMEGIEPRNQLELTLRQNEALQRLGPVVGLTKADVATALLQRALIIINRRELLPPRPKEAANLPLKFTFLDMVTLAQLAASAAGMQQTVIDLGPVSAAARGGGLPDPLRVINLDKFTRILADRRDFPMEALYTEEQTAEMDQAKAAEARQQQAQAATQAMVEGAGTLGKAKLDGTALGALAGVQPQGSA